MSFEEQLVNKINEFRTNPKGYAKKINEYIPYFKGKNLRMPGTYINFKTQEGADAYIEAVDFLSKQDGVEPFEPSKGLAIISKKYLDEMQKIDVEELDNINIDEIIEQYGTIRGDLNRAIDFGGEDPEQVLINLIISDGDPSRGNRDALLSTNLKKIGVANGKHKIYNFCTVIFICTEFQNTRDSDDHGFIYDSEEINNTYKEGKTIKPKKVSLKQKPKEESPPKKQEIYSEKNELPPKKKQLQKEVKNKIDDDDDDIPEGVVSETRTEKIVEKNGKKVRIIKIVRVMEDGTKNTSIVKEPVEDD